VPTTPDSTDDTFVVAEDAGAVVHRSADIRHDLDTLPGKGEAMCKSLPVTTGDVLVLTEWAVQERPPAERFMPGRERG
jgi:hypothetical protein